MNALTNTQQIEMYKLIVSGAPVPEYAIDAFICRPDGIQQRSIESFINEKKKVLKLREENQRKSNMIQDQFKIQQESDVFARYAQLELTERDYQELQQLTFQKGKIPCVYRLQMWARRARQDFHQDSIDFLSFLGVSGFKKYLKGEEDIQGLTKQQINEEIDVLGELDTPENNAITFVRRNMIILNDINRTLSSTALFCDGQPLFSTLCQVVTCTTVRYQRYVQGLSVLCATAIMYTASKEDALALILKLTQTKIYLRFLRMNSETLNAYAQAIFKATTYVLGQKEIQQLLKVKAPNEEELADNIFQTMNGSVVGLVLSCFGKTGHKMATGFVDMVCFCSQENVNMRYAQVLVAFYVIKIAQFARTGDIDELLGGMTKQKELTEKEVEDIMTIVEILREKPWIDQNLITVEEILKFV